RVHRLDEHEVAVRVEAPRELVPMEVEVALDGEAPAPAHRVEAALPAAREAVVELARRAVVQQGHAPREGETAVWTLAIVGAVVVTTREAGIHPDRLGLHRVQRDLIGGGDRRAGEHRETLDAIRMADGPLERLHRAHRSADHRGPASDAER